MTTRFINGGLPNYLGFIFNSGTELLEKIRDEAILAGWTVEDDLISTQSEMTLSAISGINAHKCYLVFKVTDNPNITNGKLLTLYGDLTGVGTSLSPEIYTTWIDGNEGKLWAAITESHIALCTVGIDSDYRGIHGGFCDRVDSINDAGAWYIGYISVFPYNNWVARAAHDQEIWRQVNNNSVIRWGEDWSENLRVDGGSSGCNDRYTTGQGKPYTSSTPELVNVNTIRAPITYFYKGALNRGTSTAVIGNYYLPEGRTTINDWGTVTGSTILANTMYFRGIIPNLRVGMASLSGGTQVISSANGERVLSTGGITWQGMRIV
jgi:hypothetical protein